MRGRSFRRLAAAAVLIVAVSATTGTAAFANETPHIRIAVPRTSRTRSIIFSGATTAAFPNLRAYSELGGAGCAATIAGKPRSAREFAWNDVVPQHAQGLVSFERTETVPAGDTGELHVVCAYLVNSAGHVGARAQLSYRDPALR